MDVFYNKLEADPSTIGMDVVGGRLDLVSATSIKWGFQNSNQIRLVNPDTGRWELVKCSAEPQLLNTTNDLNGTALAPNTIYDVFAEYDSSTAFNLVLSKWCYGGNGANNSSTSYATSAAISNSSPYIISATSIETSGMEAYQAFNQSDGTFDGLGSWNSSAKPTSGSPQSLMIDLGYPVCINKYVMKNRAASYPAFPKTWTFEGSNSSSSALGDASGANGWVVLDTVASSTDVASNTWEASYHTFTSYRAYRYYRIHITDSHSAQNYVTINELKLVRDDAAGYSTRIAAYNQYVTYSIGDRVTYGGHDWVCIQSGTGQTPAAGAYWVDNGTSVSGDFAGLYRYNGVLVSDSSTTGKSRRWLGIIYTYNNSGTVNFKDNVNYRFIGNYYNTLPKVVRANNSTSSWTYNGSWREANNGTGQTRGLFVVAASQWVTANSAFKITGCSADSNMNATIDTTGFQSYTAGSPSDIGCISSQLPLSVAAGYHYLTSTELGNFTVDGSVAYVCNTLVKG